MVVEQQMEIIDLVKQFYPWAKFYQMQLDKENFKLIKGGLLLLK